MLNLQSLQLNTEDHFIISDLLFKHQRQDITEMEAEIIETLCKHFHSTLNEIQLSQQYLKDRVDYLSSEIHCMKTDIDANTEDINYIKSDLKSCFELKSLKTQIEELLEWFNRKKPINFRKKNTTPKPILDLRKKLNAGG